MKFFKPLYGSSVLPLTLALFTIPFAQTRVTTTETTTTSTSTSTAKTSFEPTRASSQTPYATHGLSNVVSAEPVGAGRLNMNFRGTFYRQENSMFNTVPTDAQITTASGAVALGLNEYLDAFGMLNINNIRASSSDGSGFGSSVIGAQGSLPGSRDIPLRFGAQLAAIFGTSRTQINSNDLDGYDYLETRTGNDVMVRLTQSLLMARSGTGFNIHLNEGVISSLESGKDIALVTGIGVELIPVTPLILGIEANSRTFLNDISAEDPLWITPSVTWRSPAFVNVNLGVDIAINNERYTFANGPRNALEPWRIFGGVSYTIDTKASEKRSARERAYRDSVQKASLTRQVLSSQQKNDSLERAKTMSEARSRFVADSLKNVSRLKAHNDSLALANSNRLLDEERNKRSEMEKKLLTTGLLVLDAVYFESGKSTISINSEPYLSLIAKMLSKYPKLQIEIGGHTDNVGGMTYNQTLSQGRAMAVMNYMIKESPDLQGRLTAKGYGYSQPKADNKTAAGRQLNRRTELQVTNKEALKEYNP